MRSQGFCCLNGIFKWQASDGEGHLRKFASCCDNAIWHIERVEGQSRNVKI